jgi:hypothetical protein
MTESAIAVTNGGTQGIGASFSGHLVGLGRRVAVRYRRGHYFFQHRAAVVLTDLSRRLATNNGEG